MRISLIKMKQFRVLYQLNKQPFYIRFWNVVDENFQHHFVIKIGYCITETYITKSIIL